MNFRGFVFLILKGMPYIGPRLVSLVNLRRQNAALHAELMLERQQRKALGNDAELLSRQREGAAEFLSLMIVKQQIHSIFDAIEKLSADTNSAVGTVNAHINRCEAKIDSLMNVNRRPVSGVSPDHLFTNYLDLLEASILGNAGHAAEVSPSTQWLVARDQQEVALTIMDRSELQVLRQLVLEVLNCSIDGDFLEAGVWRRGASLYVTAILKAWGDETRRVYVADNFQDAPAMDNESYTESGDHEASLGELSVSRASVEEIFHRYGLSSDKVCFLEGRFKDTFPNAPFEQLAILRLDGHTGDGTRDALEALYGKVSPGGFAVVANYNLRACAQAVDDFRRSHKIAAPIHHVNGSTIWWQVPLGDGPDPTN